MNIEQSIRILSFEVMFLSFHTVFSFVSADVLPVYNLGFDLCD